MRSLTYKYEGEQNSPQYKILQNIKWHSIPIVYDADYLDRNSEWSKVGRAVRARKQKKYRANQYIEGMRECYYQLWFVSLTFTDEVINSTSETTRHRYVQRWCNEFCRDYYVNQDFGKTNHREHYHAVVALSHEVEQEVIQYMYERQNAKKQGMKWIDTPCRYGWEYGFSHIKPIKMSFEGDDSSKQCDSRLTGYMLKLSNHSGKLGTGKSFHKRGMKEVDSIPFL